MGYKGETRADTSSHIQPETLSAALIAFA
jgi:hypothetical protein